MSSKNFSWSRWVGEKKWAIQKWESYNPYLYADVIQLKLHVMWKVFQLLISSQNVRAYISKKNLNAENVVIWNLSAYIKEKILYAENVFKFVS